MFSQPYSVKALATIFCLFSASVNAHMMMASPEPYGKSSLDNSPLLADGSDFPCKQRAGVYDLEGASNVIAIGEPQTLSFIGSAVHGGGSCQVSLTTDQAPTKDSKWMVVHSIEGNCPSNVTGNLDANAAGTGAAVFEYTIPEGISPGQYTIAWSWVNKIGNREFYMNCGPATITGAKKRRWAPTPKIVEKRAASFPQMFVANLAGVSNGCQTTEGVDITYPDPGTSVQKGTIGVNPGPPVSCGATPPEIADDGSTSPAPAAVSSSPASGSSAAASPPAAASDSPGVFASGAGGDPSPAAVTATAVVSPLPAVATEPAAPSSPSVPASVPASGSGSGSGSGTAGAMSGPCTPEGEWFCAADGSSFQRCASGSWSVSMAMAQGTSCVPGLSSALSLASAKQKRGVHVHHFGRSHHASNSFLF